MGVEERRVVPLARNRAAILGQILIDRMRGHITGLQAAQHGFALRHSGGRNEAFDGKNQPDHLVLAIAEEAFRRRVPVDDAEIRIEQQISEGHPIDLDAQLGEQAVPLRFRLFATADIASDTDHAGDLAGRIGHARHTRVDPDAGAVLAIILELARPLLTVEDGAVSAAICGRMCSGKRARSGRPIISVPVQPKSRVAPSFQYVTRPSRLVTISESRTLAKRCDVVIMDIVMPDEEGLGTIRELRRVDPNVKIIAISGGGLGKAGDHLGIAQMLGAMRTLAKPFLPEALLAMIAEVLADPDTPKVSPHRE